MSANIETITLGGGCFWCLEAVYERVEGVTAVESGYSNGHVERPSYEQVCSGNTGNVEVVRVSFDIHTRPTACRVMTPATMSDEEKASRARTIDTKQKQLQRDGDDATAAFNAEMQETLGAVAKKLGPIVIKYVQDNGYTMLLDNTGQQGGLSVLWTQPGTTDISQAVVDAYNASSGVAAPAVPSAPSATRPRPTTTTPPKPAAPK